MGVKHGLPSHKGGKLPKYNYQVKDQLTFKPTVLLRVGQRDYGDLRRIAEWMKMTLIQTFHEVMVEAITKLKEPSASFRDNYCPLCGRKYRPGKLK